MKRFTSVALLTTLLANVAISAPAPRNCCCPPCKQPARTTVYKKPAPSKLVYIPCKHDTLTIYSEKTIHYQPTPSAATVSEKKCLSPWWIVGGALAAGTIVYFATKDNGKDVTNVTNITNPPGGGGSGDDDDDDGHGKKKKHKDD